MNSTNYVDEMNNRFEGYAVYGRSIERGHVPLAVVSNSDVCKAVASYIPNRLKECLIAIEDRRFRSHPGIDFRSISRALVRNIQARKIVQGGSTITQQLARNLLNQNDKTIGRKIRESIKAIQLERLLSKDEILEQYFNNVYFGKNLRGIRSASLYYFGKELEALSQGDVLYLFTILRGPNFYINRPDAARKRYIKINNILTKQKLVSHNKSRKNIRFQADKTPNELQIIRPQSIPFIINQANDKRKRIDSTIISEVQSYATSFVNESKYPVSVIILNRDEIIGFASKYGNEYPFIYKSNVGSTLKPLLYCYLRNNGVSVHDKFNARSNNLGWDVKVTITDSQLNLQEALLYSNNNVFLNAAAEIGIENCLTFLAETLGKSLSEMYPSSLLGATKCGISLHELAKIYSNFFCHDNTTSIKTECRLLLKKLFLEKLGFEIENAFLKTGTTNGNKDRFVVLGNAEMTFAYLRNDDLMMSLANNKSKEGSFLEHVSKSLGLFFKRFYKDTTQSFVWL